jgi:hypothetical protein
MKRWSVLLLIGGIVLLLASFAVYIVRIGYCYPAALPDRSSEEMVQFRQDCNLDSSRVVQFSGFLALFVPGTILCTTYWLIRPPQGSSSAPWTFGKLPASDAVR